MLVGRPGFTGLLRCSSRQIARSFGAGFNGGGIRKMRMRLVGMLPLLPLRLHRPLVLSVLLPAVRAALRAASQDAKKNVLKVAGTSWLVCAAQARARCTTPYPHPIQSDCACMWHSPV